ncbi:transglycosylase domain-containing protein [Nocardioides sp. 1609]|uniref:transglycosylase domain-containing protein n=1 Tax=Nocardioides sp. 1609 TaxID=2508327 RepID=UPI00106F6513|nr:transglycosylase domain-containing protein [Nocardioides sp. 1609]
MTWKRRVLKVFKWGFITGLVLTLIGIAGFVYLYKTTDIPEPNAELLTNATFVYYDDGETELGRFATQFRDSLSYEEMPQNMKDAVVAAEDQSFWTNNGIDPKGILRAVFNNASGGSQQGASTITQQYVKILYLTQERSYERKVKEAILSLKIQREYSKEQVLTGYLNTIYFGRGAYGIEAAADVYFSKKAADLTLRETAVLASVLNNPNGLDPADGKAVRLELKGRYEYVLGAMASEGYITDEESEQARRKLPKFPEQDVEDSYGGQTGHALTLIKNQVLGLTNSETGVPFTEEEIDGGGLRITTTLTSKAMDAAREGVEEVRPKGFPGAKDLHMAAATVEPGSGALRGFYAGQDFLESQLNWAVAGGQAGSTFKPFAVAAGLKQGFALKDTFDGNSPYEIEGTDAEVENQGDEDYGSSVSLTQATEDSINTAFIDLTLAMDDGPESIIETAEAMGIPPAKARKRGAYGIPTSSPGLDPVTGVALGSQTVSPINMANGYATIANEGVAADVHVISKVVNKAGDVLYEHKVTGDRAISADIASDVSYAMQQVTEAGSGTRANLDDGRPIAGKTGTATKDGGAVSSSWFVGFTPQLSTAVMMVRGVGNGQLDDWVPASDDGVDGYFGGNYPARTWKAIMERDLEGVDPEDFPEPAFVDGEAPSEGHAPYTPPPPAPSTTRQPPKTPSIDPDPPTSDPPTSEPTQEPPTTTQPPSTPPDPPETSTPPDPPETSAPPTSPAAPAVPANPRERSRAPRRRPSRTRRTLAVR